MSEGTGHSTRDASHGRPFRPFGEALGDQLRALGEAIARLGRRTYDARIFPTRLRKLQPHLRDEDNGWNGWKSRRRVAEVEAQQARPVTPSFL